MANPPVCRIMDYGKFRYEEAQKAKESRKKSMNVSVKEVKFKPKIGRGDFDTKVRKIDQFIHEGHKVKVTMQFRGREMAHPELGSKILDEVLVKVGGYAKVETQARLEGRNMSMVLSPDRKALDVKPIVATHPNGDTPAADAPDPDTPVIDTLDHDTPVIDIPVADAPAADAPVAAPATATATADAD